MDYLDVICDKISYNDPVFDSNKSCYRSIIKYDNSELILNTPKMKVIDNDDDNIILEFITKYSKFYDFITNIELLNIDTTLSNSKKWLGINTTKNIINNLYKRSIELPKALNNNPNVRLRINEDTKIIDKNGECINNTYIDNNIVECTIYLKELVFTKNIFYLEMELKEIRIKEYIGETFNCLFSETEMEREDTDEFDIITISENI